MDLQHERPAAARQPAGEEADELRAYCASSYDPAALPAGLAFPLPDEPFAAVWEEWAGQAARRGAFEVLREQLPQLRFPVRSGISQEPGYRAATLRGVPPIEIPESTGLELERPESLELAIHASPAGRIPLLVVRHRPDFVAVLRALARRNEPAPVADSQGALMVAGYNNWARVHALRRAWEARPAAERAAATWGEELKRLQARPELFQDRFILLSDGPYSAVPAADLGLGEAAWRETSLALRRDHECAHYLTRRVFGAMRNHLLDELAADFAGLVGSTGRYRADWQLRFLGLEGGAAGDTYRPGGRLDLYRGDLSDAGFAALQTLARAAAVEIERFHSHSGARSGEAGPPGEGTARDRALPLLALATLRVDEIAAPGGAERLAERLASLRARI